MQCVLGWPISGKRAQTPKGQAGGAEAKAACPTMRCTFLVKEPDMAESRILDKLVVVLDFHKCILNFTNEFLYKKIKNLHEHVPPSIALGRLVEQANSN